MSLPVFQAVLARLVTDTGFAARLRAEGVSALAGMRLDARETRRLLAVAAARGLAITQKLHRGFRLGKVLSMLPLTCALMGEDTLATEVARFWREHPARSFYFWEEAVAFCDFLLARGLPVLHLAEVVRYEHGRLLLQCACAEHVSLAWAVHPRPVLLALARGEPAPAVTPSPHLLFGERGADGGVSWSLAAVEELRAGAARLP